ncbi:haloacid dehalogenase [Paenibacillus sp. J31TS4]|uniref:HAD family hydrolase n=1 Tax=Paenibacillus sp. J31TS4 TaxID=2807195 RepID=UPI001B06B665|nr:HAD family hydrolase [Paenibacillus sp. J31TS4]GIP39572.1 haloacid dehalogenase [Paenibacillus sp. J31TS4]
MKPQTILFDMDDTLVHCNKYFMLVLDQFADLMETWFASYELSKQEVLDKQLEIDIAGVHVLGFTESHFPQSLVDTYRHFGTLTGRRLSRMEVTELQELGRSVYEHEVEPYPYMVEALQELEEDGHRLYLYTGGVEAIQMRKVKAVSLETYFQDRIFIRRHKNAEALDAILKANGFDRSQTWMVGNSMRTDVMPALENGIHAIYLPAENEWAFNVVEATAEPQGAFLTLRSLNEVRAAIGSLIERASVSRECIH